MSSHLQRIAQRHITYRKSSLAQAQAVLRYAEDVEREANQEVFQQDYAPKYKSAQDIRALGNKLLRCANNQKVTILDDRVATHCDSRCRTKVCTPCEIVASDSMAYLVYCAIEHLYENHPGCEPLALTLTLKNYPFFDGGLEAMVQHLRSSYNKFRGYALIKEHSIGFFSSTEIAVRKNKHDGTLEAGAHQHLITIRGPNQKYLPHAAYQAQWQKALDVNYRPQVRISKILKAGACHSDNALRQAIKEACKYTTKAQSYCKISYDQELRDISVDVDPRVVVTIASALYRKRLRTFDREFLIAKRQACQTIKARREQRKKSGGSLNL